MSKDTIRYLANHNSSFLDLIFADFFLFFCSESLNPLWKVVSFRQEYVLHDTLSQKMNFRMYSRMRSKTGTKCWELYIKSGMNYFESDESLKVVK